MITASDEEIRWNVKIIRKCRTPLSMLNFGHKKAQKAQKQTEVELSLLCFFVARIFEAATCERFYYLRPTGSPRLTRRSWAAEPPLTEISRKPALPQMRTGEVEEPSP